MGVAASAETILPEFARFTEFKSVASAGKLMNRFEKVQPEFGWAISEETFQKLFPKVSASDIATAFARLDSRGRGPHP